MLDLLKSAVKNGFKSSEFYLALIALLFPLIDGAVQQLVNYLNSAQATTHNPIYVVILSAAAAAISAAYSIARALVKREQIRQMPTAAALDGYQTPNPNVRTDIPSGSADAERLHAISAGAPPGAV